MRYTFKLENDKLICVCHDTSELSNNFDTYIKNLKFVNMKISNLDKNNYESVTFKNNCVYLKDNNDNVVKFVNFGELVFKYQINNYLPNNFSKIKTAIFNYQKNKITKQLPKNIKLNKGKIIVASTILGMLCGGKILQDKLVNDSKIIEKSIENENDVAVSYNNENIITEYKKSIDEMIENKTNTDFNELNSIEKGRERFNIAIDDDVYEQTNKNNYKQVIDNVEPLKNTEIDEQPVLSKVSNTIVEEPVEITNTNEQIYLTSTIIPINIENNSDDELINNINTNYGEIINECSEKWGISSNLITALIRQESNGTLKNLGQIEFYQWNDMPINIHNFITDKDEKVVLTNNPSKYSDATTISEEELMNPKTNISMSTIILRYNLERNNYNVPITIQEYNYGCGNMSKVLTVTANNSGITKNDIINDPTNLDFMDYRTIINGGNKRHGDDEYIEHVLQYVDGDIIIKMKDSDDIVYNVEHQKSLNKVK